MKDHELEAYLIAARPTGPDYSPFTQSVLESIRSQVSVSSEKQPIWRAIFEFMHQTTLRRVVTLALVAVVTAFISLSGYAYATGTNPISLIKRWIVGEQVKVTYQDPQTSKQREFSYGAKRSYSDVAVSAFAEVSLIDQLHFYAANTHTVPKDGIEYIDDPFQTDFIAPRVGVIEQVNQENIVVHLTYSVGLSKVERSQDIDERITIPRAYFYFYEAGKPAAVQYGAAGKLVEIFQDQYLKHRQHSGERPMPVDLYSAFVLTYPLEAIKEATATNGPMQATTDEELNAALSQQDITELDAGAWAEVCLGNGADTCPHAFNADDGDNFFAPAITPGEYGGPSRQNPDVIPFGEAVANPTPATLQYQLRYIEGRITKLSGDRITIKTSSGALWTFQYSLDSQQAFGKTYGRPLKTGELVAGGVIASVYDWDQRDFDSQHVFGMSRYR